jgi:hypothetical protein
VHRRLAVTVCVAASLMAFGVAPAGATSSNASFAMFVEDNSARRRTATSWRSRWRALRSEPFGFGAPLERRV